MAVGLPMKTTYADGDVYSAQDVNDITGTINANVNPFVAGKNKIINGDFRVWARGTSFTSPAANAYTADRWLQSFAVAPTTYSVTQQTFTPGTAPVAGYEGSTFYRGTITTVGSNTAWEHKQRIEDVRSFAGQTVTISFWAKADSSRTGRIFFYQVFGTGGSTAVYSTAYNFSLTSSWQRFTQTVSIASISGKTIGTGSYIEATIEQPAASGSVIDIWGVQVEAGSTATAFQTATGTIQGELAACQRYFQMITSASGSVYTNFATGAYYTTTAFYCQYYLKTTMRVAPSASVSGTFVVVNNGALTSANSVAGDAMALDVASFNVQTAGRTAGNGGWLASNNNNTTYIYLNAEL
jgi:hypothetical protein